MKARSSVLFLYGSPKEKWPGVAAISKNLIDCYTAAAWRCQAFHVREKNLIDSILKFKPNTICFFVPAQDILLFLKRLEKTELRPRLIFHVMGNFSFSYHLWLKATTTLKKFSLVWVAASTRHKELIRSFVEEECNVALLPFPVRAQDYNFSSYSRRKFRRVFGIPSKTKLICYAGRLSLEKNIPLLLSLWKAIRAQAGDPFIKLVLVGEIGSTAFYKELKKFWTDLSPQERNDLIILPRMKLDGITAVYSASDGYLSLSSYGGEDFGMSPAEAMCSGLPLLISDWGGYADFADSVLGRVSLIQLSGGKNGRIYFSDSAFRQAKLWTDEIDPIDRKKCRRNLSFDLKQSRKKILSLLNSTASPFGGFVSFGDSQNFSRSSALRRSLFYLGPGL
jgi:glycosyltransferase involved in cell wall biosynthesis